jgi:c-type cytochrome biogenesis protein CcmF
MLNFALLAITDGQSLAEAFRLSLFGDTTVRVGMGLGIAAFLLCAAGIIRRDERFVHAARQAQYLLFLVTAVSAGVLWTMLFDGLFVSNYVYRVSEQQEQFFYKLVGLWASQEGSVLFWCLILSFVGAVFAFTSRHTRTDRRLPATLLVLFAVEVFFFMLMLSESTSPFTLGIAWLNNPEWADMTIQQFHHHWEAVRELRVPGGLANPLIDASLGTVYDSAGLRVPVDTPTAMSAFSEIKMSELYQRLVYAPELVTESVKNVAVAHFSDGQGMNPQLHNYWIAIHPPTLYLGYIGFTIPFCYAVGSLISGELGTEWIRKARLWTMTAWVFLTAGIAMGGLWAYEILGWGGYWAWDPVENASFIPWLTATAFIHSVIVQERRGMLKAWNVILIILTYCMTIVGTFLVRSGIVESVHAFGDTGLKWPLLFFMGVIFLGSILLVVWRMPLLRSERRMESVLSREGIFLVNNLVLVMIALITLVMTLWPAFSEFFLGETSKHTFGETAYTMINAPLFMLLLLMTGIGPLMAWGRSPARQIISQLAWPLAFSGVVALINVWRIVALGIAIKVPFEGDTIATGVNIVRLVVQFTLFPILALIVASVLQELLQATRIRQRASRGGFFSSAFGAVMANRRRFGGYIAHIGMALVAIGIYFSSFYETDTSAQLPRGGYAMVGREGGKWVVLNDIFAPSSLFRELVGGDDGRDPGVQKILQAAQVLRRNPDVSDRELALSVRTQTRFPDTLNLRPEYRGALRQMQTNPSINAEELLALILANAPGQADNPQVVSRMRAGFARVEQYLTLTDEDRALAQEMAVSTRSYEFYQSVVRLIQYQPEVLSEAEAHEYALAYWTAYSLEHGLQPPSGAGETTRDAALQQLVALTYRYGPDCFPLLDAIHGALTRDIAAHGAFRRKLKAALHDRERQEVRRMLADYSDDSRAGLQTLGWRALGGLRDAEAMGSEEEKARAKELIARLLPGMQTVRPRIQMFYDKRNGEPRPTGESVRDPEIHTRLSEDVYLILQGVDIRDIADQSSDIAIFRIFIKPGILLGIMGLIVIVLGSFFALLPRRRSNQAVEG